MVGGEAVAWGGRGNTTLLYGPALWAGADGLRGREAIPIVQCFHKENWQWIMDNPDMVTVKAIYYSLTFIAWALAIAWNLGIIIHIYSESVSNILHETYLVKKETEFCLGISANWLTRYFFFFSNFRSGV